MSLRKAKHSGSWYSDSSVDLSCQLNSWLQKAEFIHGPARAIITPHAGYRYSGSCAAHAYKQIAPETVKRIFILGPSHHFSLSGCALSTAYKFQTPLYDLTVDSQVNNDLYSTGNFEWLNLNVDEKEHSIEMQLPFVAKIMDKYESLPHRLKTYKDQFTIIPVLVGSLSPEKQARYGKLFAKYLKEPQNVFIISSDFCHWGPQFRYTYQDTNFKNIYESIENLDYMGMKAIENLNPSEFNEYLKKYGNTICGRHVIGILLNAIKILMEDSTNCPKLKFLKYTQSNRCLSASDSSVSYAAGVLTID